MLQVISITIPLFSIIFLGWMACFRFGDSFNETAALHLTKFASHIAMPALLFYHIAHNPAHGFFNLGFIWRYELVTITMILLAFGVGKLIFGLKQKDAAIFGLASSYSNYGYMGLPLVVVAFGRDATVPIALILFVDSLVLLLTTALLTSTGNNTSRWDNVKKIFKNISRNPLIISVVTAVAFLESGLTIPKVADNFLSILADGAVPVALFALGVTLYGQRKKVRTAFRQVLSIATFKLFIHPLLVVFVFLILPHEGQDPIWIRVAIVVSAMPIGINAFVLSRFYDTYSDATAAAILVSTVTAIVTAPIVLYWAHLGV